MGRVGRRVVTGTAGEMGTVPEGLTSTKLRQLANWFDTYDRMAEKYIEATSDQFDPLRIAELLAIVRGDGVQDDLRRWADDLDASGSWDGSDG
jgi:hypothetical protein